jgi:hypothetical protein
VEYPLLFAAFIYALVSILVLIRQPDELNRAQGLRRWRVVNWVALGFLAILAMQKIVQFLVSLAGSLN